MLRAYRTEAKYEFLKTLRQPAYVIPTLTFPLIFYVMFGIVFGGKQAVGDVNLATYLLATYSAFGVIGASLFGFAVGVAMERGYGWLQVKRASPMPPLAYLMAKAVMAMIFSAILVVSLFVVGVAFGGVHLSIGRFLGLAGTVIDRHHSFLRTGAGDRLLFRAEHRSGGGERSVSAAVVSVPACGFQYNCCQSFCSAWRRSCRRIIWDNWHCSRLDLPAPGTLCSTWRPWRLLPWHFFCLHSAVSSAMMSASTHKGFEDSCACYLRTKISAGLRMPGSSTWRACRFMRTQAGRDQQRSGRSTFWECWFFWRSIFAAIG